MFAAFRSWQFGPGAALARVIPRKGGNGNMREYEVTVVLQPDLDDEARSQLIERFQGWLMPEGVEIPEPTINHWGKRQLAYPINDFTEGYYIYYELMLDPANVAEINRNVKFNENILRHLIVRKDE